MAVKSIGYRPDLTIEQTQDIFAAGFRARYDIVTTEARTRHFIVCKDGWCGVGVKVQQQKNETRLVFTAMIPNFWLQFFFGGLFSYPLLRGTWKAMEAEVAEFIASEPAFIAEDQASEQLKAA